MTTRDETSGAADEPGGGRSATPASSLVERATNGSVLLTRVQQIGATGAAFVRESALYRWLTAEPEPEVIVIDLRETWTVGPIIALVDQVVDDVVAGSRSSWVVRAGRRLGAQTRETPLRVGGTLALAVGVLAVVTALAGDAVQRGRLFGGVVALLGGAMAVRDDRSVGALRETQVGAIVERGGELVLRALEPPAPPASETDERESAVRDAATDSSDSQTTASLPDTAASGATERVNRDDASTTDRDDTSTTDRDDAVAIGSDGEDSTMESSDG